MSILAHEAEILIVYDGNCRMCTVIADALARRSDLMTHIIAVPSQDLAEFSTVDLPMLRAHGELETLLSAEDFDANVVAVEVRRGATPVIYRGARAIGRLSQLLPGPWPLLGRILRTGRGQQVGEKVYGLVARNRPGCGPTCER
ncbi:hypothetical protein BSZ39_02050 [Bowdeniella nasicola]|uniref:Thiol-disulfide oxidoreductase n=1 Tax=Bowdeniella nasicola TaxID=208480 RepID=A0A1Q5Q4N5_9ACTO|nr:DCC1-like thiol-disulfide oxidoreductase family protein [Bowdeniella nasicola]OKL54785.1 hypothetical protein BSZ39_02050 [Bowdeniella nasicola]